MSSNLRKAKLFLACLLDKFTPLNQKHALVFTASELQVKAVAEIVYNLNAGVIPLPKSTKALLQKNKKLIRGIIRASARAKSKLIRDGYKRVCELIGSVRRLVLELLA